MGMAEDELLLDIRNPYQPIGYDAPPFPDMGDRNTPFEIDCTPLFFTSGISPSEQFGMELLERVVSDNARIVSRWHEYDEGSKKHRYLVSATPVGPVSDNAFAIAVRANHRRGKTKPIKYTASYVMPERGRRSDVFTLHLESGIDGNAVVMDTEFCRIGSNSRDKVTFAVVKDFIMDWAGDPSQLNTQHPFNRGLVCIPWTVAGTRHIQGAI
jgi:hypothetical protein